MIRRELATFFAALGYFTRLPVPGWVGYSPDGLARAARYLPAIGLLVGGVGALVFWLAGQVWVQPVAVVLSMIATIALTGAFHEDGLGDTADGLGGGWDKAKILAIMKDSRVGSYGVIAIVLALLGKFALLSTLPAGQVVAALIAGHAVSRFCAVSLMATMDYARAVASGKLTDSRLFFFHRQASDEHDLSTPEGVRAAVIEASGPAAKWSDIDGICEQWRDPTSDKTYLERVWLNRLVRSSERAFDAERWKELARPEGSRDYRPAPGSLVVLGFDGARWHDATALVGTEVETGFQWLVGLWERPETVDEWEVPADEVNAAVQRAFERWNVWRMYADPPYWETMVATWAGTFGEDRVVAWWTNRVKAMAYAIKGFVNSMKAGELGYDGNPDYARHIGNAMRKKLNMVDEDGSPLWVIYKERADSPHKIDGAMAGILSWQARCDALTAGVAVDGRSVYEDRGILTL